MALNYSQLHIASFRSRLFKTFITKINLGTSLLSFFLNLLHNSWRMSSQQRKSDCTAAENLRSHNSFHLVTYCSYLSFWHAKEWLMFISEVFAVGLTFLFHYYGITFINLPPLSLYTRRKVWFNLFSKSKLVGFVIKLHFTLSSQQKTVNCSNLKPFLHNASKLIVPLLV